MDSYLQILPIYRYAEMEKLYLSSADIYRQAYLQILSADIIIGRTLPIIELTVQLKNIWEPWKPKFTPDY